MDRRDNNDLPDNNRNNLLHEIGGRDRVHTILAYSSSDDNSRQRGNNHNNWTRENGGRV